MKQLLLLLLFTFMHDQSVASSNSLDPGPNDTLVTFRVKGRNVSFRTSKLSGRRFQGLQELIDTSQSSELVYTRISAIDVTGDGILDTCTTEIKYLNGLVKVEHFIRALNLTIWYDAISLTNEDGEIHFWHDSALTTYGPYLNFQAARSLFTDFVRGPADVSFSAVYPILQQTRKNEDWQAYLARFKGRLVETMDLINTSLYIWDSKTNRFILYFAP